MAAYFILPAKGFLLRSDRPEKFSARAAARSTKARKRAAREEARAEARRRELACPLCEGRGKYRDYLSRNWMDCPDCATAPISAASAATTAAEALGSSA